jgi:hypothetical protein
MSFYRVTLLALATLFTGIASAAFADCCGWGTPAPVAYASCGCGGCGAAFAPMAYAPAPLPVAGWGTGCGGGWGGCGQSLAYVAAPIMEPQIAPAPIYVANQGPEYAGPGIMIPYRTWATGAPAAIDYPYVSSGYGYGYGYGHPYHHGRRYAYGAHYGHPHASWWRYPHRPLGVRY